MRSIGADIEIRAPPQERPLVESANHRMPRMIGPSMSERIHHPMGAEANLPDRVFQEGLGSLGGG